MLSFGGAMMTRPALAQSTPRTCRIGTLAEGRDRGPGQRNALDPFVEGLRELGYVPDQNLTIEYRFADGRAERLPLLAAELVALKLDLIVAVGTREALALQKATSTIPILMVGSGDPVGAGLVKSLASPGGNITGTSLMFPDVGGKRLELLREIVPTLRRVAILGNPGNASTAADIRATEAAATAMGIAFHTVAVEAPDRLADGLGEILALRPDGLIVIQDNIVSTHRETIAAFTLRNRLVSIFPSREYVAAGGLICYGPSYSRAGRRAAIYADKIFKGARPADLPVEQPTRFDLVVNMRTPGRLAPPSRPPSSPAPTR